MANPDITSGLILGFVVLLALFGLGWYLFLEARNYFRSIERRNEFLRAISKLSSKERRILLNDLQEAKGLADVYDKIDGA